MSFGKRGGGNGGGGNGPSAPKPNTDGNARSLLPPRPPEDDGTLAAVRTKVAKPGGLDKGFIALAVGVVAVSAGAAVAAPSVFSMFDAVPLRPIEQVIAGLDRDQVKVALAREAFPDGEGKSFMTSLQTHFPADYSQLLDRLTYTAMQGGDRDMLLSEINGWSFEWTAPHLADIGHTGADGFDEALSLGQGAINVIEKTVGCTADKFEAITKNPAKLASLWTYGTEGYKFSMKSARSLVDLAARGRTLPPPATDLRKEDEEALLTAFVGMMFDPQLMNMISASFDDIASGPGGYGASSASAASSKIDICKFGRSIIYKAKRLPFGTKERLWGLGTQGMDAIMSNPFMKSFIAAGPDGMPMGIPGINAPPNGFPIEMMQGPSIADMQKW